MMIEGRSTQKMRRSYFFTAVFIVKWLAVHLWRAWCFVAMIILAAKLADRIFHDRCS